MILEICRSEDLCGALRRCPLKGLGFESPLAPPRAKRPFRITERALRHLGTVATVKTVARLHDIVFDCRQPASLARFSAEALDGYRVTAAYDEEELRRLADRGIDDPQNDPTVLVEGSPGQPRYFFALVPEGKVVKNRVHLDLAAEDQPRRWTGW